MASGPGGPAQISGDLSKLGGFLQKKWQKRYFRLEMVKDGAQGRSFPALFYFSDSQSAEAKARIDLVGAVTVSVVLPSSAPQPPADPGTGETTTAQGSLAVGGRLHCFSLTLWRDGNVRRVYYLSAEDAAGCEAWVRALRDSHRAYLARLRGERQAQLRAQAAGRVLWPTPAPSLLPLLTVDDTDPLSPAGEGPGLSKLRGIEARLGKSGLLALEDGERSVLHLAATPSALPQILSRQGPEDGLLLTSRRILQIECGRLVKEVSFVRTPDDEEDPEHEQQQQQQQQDQGEERMQLDADGSPRLDDAFFVRRGLMGAADLHVLLRSRRFPCGYERIVPMPDAESAHYLSRLLYDGPVLGLQTLPWAVEQSPQGPGQGSPVQEPAVAHEVDAFGRSLSEAGAAEAFPGLRRQRSEARLQYPALRLAALELGFQDQEREPRRRRARGRRSPAGSSSSLVSSAPVMRGVNLGLDEDDEDADGAAAEDGTGVRIDHLGNVIRVGPASSAAPAHQGREGELRDRLRAELAGLSVEELCAVAGAEDALHDPVLGYDFGRERATVERAARLRKKLEAADPESRDAVRVGSKWYFDESD